MKVEFDIHTALKRLREVVDHLPEAALFDLFD